jgi:hypothetical protein
MLMAKMSPYGSREPLTSTVFTDSLELIDGLNYSTAPQLLSETSEFAATVINELSAAYIDSS